MRHLFPSFLIDFMLFFFCIVIMATDITNESKEPIVETADITQPDTSTIVPSETSNQPALSDNPSVVSTTADTSTILTSSENINNENREKELLLNTDTTQAEAATPEATAPESTTDEYANHITYNEKGVAIYTDPSTKYQYEFDNEKNDWVPVTEENKIIVDPYENEHYRWCHATNKWIPKEHAKESATATETEFYKFDAEKNEWIPKCNLHTVTTVENEDGEDVHTYTDAEGAVFFWCTEKNAWFPKIDDDFMAKYQMGYGNYVITEKEMEEARNPIVLPKANQVDKVVTAKRKATQPEQPRKFLFVHT